MKKNNAIYYVVMAIGAFLIVMGILAFTDTFAGSESRGDYAKFGADFYTIVSQNAARAASNTGNILSLLKPLLGAFFIGLGSLSCCFAVIKKQEAERDYLIYNLLATMQPKSDHIDAQPVNEINVTDQDRLSAVEQV